MVGDFVDSIAALTECESAGSSEISHPVMPMTAIAASVQVRIGWFMFLFVSKKDGQCFLGFLEAQRRPAC